MTTMTTMKINFKPSLESASEEESQSSPPMSPAQKELLSLKARYGDDWSIEATLVGPIIYYWQGKPIVPGKAKVRIKVSETITRDALRLLNKDREARGLLPIYDVGMWR